MNILFVAPMPIVASRGGIQRVTDVLAKEFKLLNHNVYFLCRREEDLIKSNNFSAPQFIIRADETEGYSGVEAYLEKLEELQIDCIIFQWVDDLIYHWLKVTPSKYRVVSVIHHQPFAGYGYEREIMRSFHPHGVVQLVWKFIGICFPFVQRRMNMKWHQRSIERLLPFSDRVCFLSGGYISRARKFGVNIPDTKACMVGNPCCLSGQEINFQDKKNIVLFVGRISNSTKNTYQFLRVWHMFSAKYKNWEAYVIGDGPDLEVCKRYAQKNQIERVSFLGHCQEVQNYYANAKAICMTSYGEGFGMVLTEGMSYGCVPFVYDTYEAVHDIIVDRKSGFLSPPFDTGHMVSNLQLIADSQEYYMKIAQEAIVQTKRFNSRAVAERWIEIMNNIEK